MQILGNLELRRRLDEALHHAPPAPAYLFVGPRGVGKGLMASWLAARLLCTESPAPCGRCLACHKVTSGNHADVMIMDRVEGKASLGIDDVREGIAAVQLRPYEGRYRLWILAEAGRLTEEAQSALLKTLEEPPPHLVLVLVAGGEDALLPTVTSRCRILRFGPVAPEEIADWLVGRGVGADRAGVAARISGGSPGAALDLVGSSEIWELREAVLRVVTELPGAGLGQAMDAATALEGLKTGVTDPKADLNRVLEVLASWFRDAACLAVGAGQELLVNLDHLGGLEALVARSDPRRLEGALRCILEAGEHVRRNVQPRFLLQRLCLELARAGHP